jgi:hypothetical protein
MRADWEGVYLDGRVSARRPARVRVLPDALEVHLEAGPPLRWPYPDVVQTQGFYAGQQVRLEPRGAAVAVVVLDPGILTAIHRAAGSAARHLHRPARRRLRGPAAVLATVAVVGLVALLYLRGIPAVAAAVAPHVPVSWAAPAVPEGSGTLYFAPVGDFPPETLARLERYYSDRFGLRIERLPAMPLEAGLTDASRRQLVAEEVVAAIRRHHSREPQDPAAVLIGSAAGVTWSTTSARRRRGGSSCPPPGWPRATSSPGRTSARTT